MKKSLLIITIGLLLFSFSRQAIGQEWKKLDEKSSSIETKIKLLSSSQDQIRLEFNFEAYALEQVSTSKGIYNLINIPKCSRIQEKGAPDLPKVSQAVAIPDFSEMVLKVISSKFIEIDGIDLAPSKGIITRDKDPKSIPFVFGEEYSKNEFYPANIATVNNPYIIRNVRGQNVVIYPVQYNPVTKKVRIYTNLTVDLVSAGKSVNNTLNVNPIIKNDEVFNNVISNHFINYSTSAKYTPVSESGKKMLIVCYTDFMDEMAEFVTWKQSIGYTVNLVDYSTIGSASALKTYVTNQYTTNGISYLLLVGDHAQVPSSSTTAGNSDNNYGYTSGTDHYLDIFVGRFSAETAAQLQTQIDRTIYYESEVSSSDTWFKNGVGIASNEGEGGGGDDDESDETHMNNIATDLEGYGYNINPVYQDGGSATQLSSYINSGCGIINYVGHGSNTTWSSMVYTQTNVDALTNENKLPFVISVACVVGNFTSITCFAETWLRSTNNNNPTGAIVFCGSTINQSWASPMCAQDEMNDLLVANSYITYGGMFVNGMFQMIDEYSTDGANMADTWTVFGDPSLQMRTPGHPSGPNSSVTTAPTVTTNSVSLISTTSAIGGGNVTANGGATVTASGIVYSTSTTPTLTTGTVLSTSPVTTSGTYSLTMSSLTPGTNYYVRAYATNSVGTSYGNQVSFTTPISVDPTAPTAPTNLASANIAQTTFTLSWTASTDN